MLLHFVAVLHAVSRGFGFGDTKLIIKFCTECLKMIVISWRVVNLNTVYLLPVAARRNEVV